jgi:hypothetical protein
MAHKETASSATPGLIFVITRAIFSPKQSASDIEAPQVDGRTPGHKRPPDQMIFCLVRSFLCDFRAETRKAEKNCNVLAVLVSLYERISNIEVKGE